MITPCLPNTTAALKSWPAAAGICLTRFIWSLWRAGRSGEARNLLLSAARPSSPYSRAKLIAGPVEDRAHHTSLSRQGRPGTSRSSRDGERWNVFETCSSALPARVGVQHAENALAWPGENGPATRVIFFCRFIFLFVLRPLIAVLSFRSYYLITSVL